MATNITISTGDTTTVVTVPEVQNNITVSKNEITSAEREKISNMVTLDGAQTISGAKTFTGLTSLNTLYTTGPSAFTGEVLMSGGDLSITAGSLSVSGTSSFQDNAIFQSDLQAQSLNFVGNGTSIIAPASASPPGDVVFPDDLEIRSNGNVVVKLDYDDNESGQKFKVTDNNENVKFSVDEDGSVAFSEYNFPTTVGSATQVLKVNSAGDGLEFGDASVVASLNDLGDADVDYNDWNGVTQGSSTLYNALVWDGTNWVMYNSIQASVPANTTNISFLGDAAPIDKSKIGFDGFNNGLSINSDTSYASSGINLYVDGGARIDGAIQVNDPSSTGYAFPTTDGTANQLLATDGSGAVTFVTPSTSNVTEGTNLYYTDARVAANSAVAANTAKVSYPTADSTKVAFISVTQAVDLDTMESDIATNNAKVGYTDSAVDTRIAAASISDLSDVPTIGTAGQVLVVNSGATALEYANQTGGVTSVNTQTGAVVLDTDDIAEGTTNLYFTDAKADARIAAASIDDLSDVDTSTVAPTDGQALVWDNANSKWEPGTVSGGGSSQWTTVNTNEIYYNSGNVGIGNTDPDATLDVDGDVDIELDSSTSETFTIHDGTHDLFQVDTGTTGTIFSVNDVSGLPKLTVDDSDGVTIDKFKEVKYEKPSNTDFSYQGDVVYFGATTSMTQGDLYYYNSSGNWAQADADAASSSGGVLLAIALGTASDTNGMLLKGTFTMAAGAIDGTEATGDELYVSTTAGHVTSAAPTATGDIVRVVGYMLDGTNGQIWFNPSNDFITLA